MTNVVRRGFHSELAVLFANDVHYQKSSLYYFIGKTEPWASSDIAPVQIQPDSQSEDFVIRSNALYLKKISQNDVSLVTQRFDWKSGTVFAKWDHTKDMSGKNFYCLTSNNIVYKCLDNDGGGPSTVKPSGTSFQVTQTSDGYTWKYMYTIPTFKRARFTSEKYIPVQRALSDSFYNKGSVDEVVIKAHGIGYIDRQATTVSVSGGTTGINAQGKIFTDDNGKIISVTITNGGSGYTAGVRLNLQQNTGYGGQLDAVVTAGVITNISIISSGIGYTNSSDINFQVGGAILVPSISRLTGSIKSVKVIDAGIGYISVPTLSVVGLNGTGKYGNSTAITSAIVYQGKVVGATVSDPGVNYPTSSDTTIVVSGNGTDAAFSPVIYNGSLIDVVVENAGNGYTSINLTVMGSGSGAIIVPTVAASDFTSDQSIVEQTSVTGLIYSIDMVNQGTGYFSTTTTAKVIGDGTGCTATPVVVDGKIIKVVLNSFGTNYTFANIVFSDSQRDPSGTSIDATAYAIFPPIYGHGRDAITELNASTVAINSLLQQEFSLGAIHQDYRQYGLIKNPTNILTGKILDANSYLITYSVVLNTVTGLIVDEILTLQDSKYRVVSIGSGNIVVVQQIGTKNEIPVGLFTADNASDIPRNYISSAILTYPIANKYSGSLLYVSNESPFSFTENQGITIKTFLTF